VQLFLDLELCEYSELPEYFERLWQLRQLLHIPLEP
jgi:hypothetical protein